MRGPSCLFGGYGHGLGLLIEVVKSHPLACEMHRAHRRVGGYVLAFAERRWKLRRECLSAAVLYDRRL